MKISIITINYNNILGLKKTTKSVLRQIFQDYEWIVIDGGSSDGSKEYIESHKSNITYWCSEPDRGIYNALNKGLKYAKGDYVLFLNSGDWLYDESTLEDVSSTIKKDNASYDIYYGDMIQVDKGGKLNPVTYPDELGLFFFHHNNICHQATFYRSSLFYKNLYDEDFSIVSDWAMNLNLIFQGCTFKHIKKRIVYYDNQGISSLINKKHYEERIAAILKYVPQQIQIDLSWYEKNYFFSRHRKSTRFLLDKAITFCQRLDNILRKKERRGL